MRISHESFPFQDFFENQLDEESVILTLVPAYEVPNEEHQMQPSVSSASEASLKTDRTDDKGMRTRNAQFAAPPALGNQGKVYIFFSIL